MANRVDISSDGKSAAKKKDKNESAPGSSGNAIKLAIVAVCFVLAGGVLWWNFFKPAPLPPPQPAFDPMEGLTPKEQEQKKRQMEIEERELKLRPPSSS